MATCYDDDIGGCDFDAACKARTDETSWHFLRACRASFIGVLHGSVFGSEDKA